ncbi:cytochrome c biogenesis CcdA family protein [Saccharopolyspora sp. SCSIO 74807]|uniref:cytochrome c biogenesis CcdA family protein n=1 Tax=Saccharopolyspora sp. SCSIO 74807 TaxID=3118084 RepID=UPI0030CC116C
MTDFVISGPLLLAMCLSLAAGAISFASPCSLPLVPGYLAYLAGLAGTAPGTAEPTGTPRRKRGRLLAATALFIAGFTVVFTAAAVVVLGTSDALLRNEALLQRIGGVVTVIMGLAFLGLIPTLQRDYRLHRRPGAGMAGAPVLGAVFGLGWTPCLGPTLTGVIALAAGTDTTVRGVILVVAYSAGLGLPFLALAAGASWAVSMTDWLRRHVRIVQITGGVLLLVIGLLLVTGLWGAMLTWLRGPIAGVTLPI